MTPLLEDKVLIMDGQFFLLCEVGETGDNGSPLIL